MTYLLLEGEFAENQKIQTLSDKAFRLHVSALVHCARNLTDGAISELDLVKVGAIAQLARPKRVVPTLETAGLWERNGNGWKIHHYLDHNPSRAEILRKRALSRARVRRHRWKDDAQGNASSNALGDALVTRDKPTASSNPTEVGVTAAAGDTHAKRSPAAQNPKPKTRPDPNARCPDCDETYGAGHLDNCPRLAKNRTKATV